MKLKNILNPSFLFLRVSKEITRVEILATVTPTTYRHVKAIHMQNIILLQQYSCVFQNLSAYQNLTVVHQQCYFGFQLIY